MKIISIYIPYKVLMCRKDSTVYKLNREDLNRGIGEVKMSKNSKSPVNTAGTYIYYLKGEGISNPQYYDANRFYDFVEFVYDMYEFDELPHTVELPGGKTVRFDTTIINDYDVKRSIIEDECISMLMELELVIDEEGVEVC